MRLIDIHDKNLVEFSSYCITTEMHNNANSFSICGLDYQIHCYVYLFLAMQEILSYENGLKWSNFCDILNNKTT